MYRSINGIRMYVEEKGQGPALLFIHGLGENADSWRHQMDFFQTSFHVISMDLRGHHRSDDGEEFITMELFARDIVALLDELGIEKAHFVGLSMGGLICQELTKTCQDRMLTMTLADAAGFYPEEMSVHGLEERMVRIKTLPMKLIGEFVGRAATKADLDPTLLSEITQMFQLNRNQPYAQATESTFKADYREIHHLIDIPTFILVGELDAVTPISFAQFLQTNIKNSKMQIIPDAAHMSKLENPSGFNRALLEFLTPFEIDSCARLLEKIK